MGCPQEDSRRNTAWDVRQERSNDNRRTAGKHRRGCPQDIDFFVTLDTKRSDGVGGKATPLSHLCPVGHRFTALDSNSAW